MKYRLKVYYRTELLNKVTGYMQDIMADWKRNDTKLQVCRTFEFESDKPLPPEALEKVKVCKEDWMDEIVVEEVPV